MRLLLFLLLFVTTLNAQEKDTLALKSYSELSDLININFTDSVPELSERITLYYVNKAKKESNVKEEINGLAKYIDIQIKARQFDTFEDEEKKLFALATSDELKEDLMTNVYILGYSYFFQGLLGQSLEMHTKALTLAREINNIKIESAVLTQLGYVKSVIGDHKTSIIYQKEALNLNRRQGLDNSSLDDRRLRAEVASLYFLSRTYINSKEKDSANVYVNEAIEINQLVNDSCLAKALYRTKGEVELLYDNYNKAISLFEDSKNYCLPLTKGDSLLYSGCYGRAYFGLKEYDKALKVLQKGADDYGVKSEEEGFMDDHYKLLAKAYKFTGDIENSNLYFEKYIHTTEEFSKIQDTVVSFFKTQEAKEFKAELNTIQSEKNKQENYLKYLALSASLVILTLLFFLLKFYKTKKKNELKFQELLSKVNTSSVEKTIIDTKDEALEESSISDVNEETTQLILTGLQKLEEQEYFLRQDCNSYNVAKKIKTNTSYLSKVVNSHYQKNFNTYINDLRINHAIVRLKNDSRFRSFSIQSIAEELGYKSADSFTKYFKQKTGLNPSFYIKQLNNLD